MHGVTRHELFVATHMPVEVAQTCPAGHEEGSESEHVNAGISVEISASQPVPRRLVAIGTRGSNVRSARAACRAGFFAPGSFANRLLRLLLPSSPDFRLVRFLYGTKKPAHQNSPPRNSVAP